MRRFLVGLGVITWFAIASNDVGAQGAGAPKGFGGGAAPAAADVLMQALDTNRDGTISAAELRMAVKSLKALDRNRDGSLNPDELRPAAPVGAGAGAGPAAGKPAAGKPAGGGAAKGAAGGGVPGFGAGAGGAAGGGFGNPAGNPGFGNQQGNPGFGNLGGRGGGGGFSRPPGSGAPSQMTKIMGFDRNRDGRVTRQEIPKQLLPWFERADLDRNGSIDLKELRMFERSGGR